MQIIKTIDNTKYVMKIDMMKSLQLIKPGESMTYDCKTAGKHCTIISYVSRLNKAAGYPEYSIKTDDNGMTYTVTRSAR